MALSVEAQAKVEQLGQLVASLPPRRRLNVLLTMGIPADVVMGVEDCTGHQKGKPMGDYEPLSFEGESVWCRKCFYWWRVPS